MRLYRLTIFILSFTTILVAASVVLAERRIALVIGNGAYPNIGELTNPPNDARLMAGTLRSLGFEVIEEIDVGQKPMKKAIKAFGDRLREAGKDAVGLFYYAGHGVQVDGVNYLVPINVEINDEADVDIEAVSMNAVLKNMEYAGNDMNIIIMDSCRNNPFKRGFRSASRGLARMDASKGTLIAYATSPGDVAADGKGKNSPYTAALSKFMLTQGLTVERMFKEVRNQVVAVTNSKQVPWEASSLTGADFYFKPGKALTVLQASLTPNKSLNLTAKERTEKLFRSLLLWEIGRRDFVSRKVGSKKQRAYSQRYNNSYIEYRLEAGTVNDISTEDLLARGGIKAGLDDKATLTIGPYGNRIIYKKQGKETIVDLPTGHEKVNNSLAHYLPGIKRIADVIFDDVSPLDATARIEFEEYFLSLGP